MTLHIRDTDPNFEAETMAAIIRVLAKAAIAATGKWWRAYTIRRARIAAIRELHTLDDHMLKDIGLSRSEIDWVLVHGRDAPRLHWTSQPRSGHTSSSGDADLARHRTGWLAGVEGTVGLAEKIQILPPMRSRLYARVLHGSFRFKARPLISSMIGCSRFRRSCVSCFQPICVGRSAN